MTQRVRVSRNEYSAKEMTKPSLVAIHPILLFIHLRLSEVVTFISFMHNPLYMILH